MEAMQAAKWLGVTGGYEATIAVLRQAEGANQRSRNSLKQPDGMLDEFRRKAVAALAHFGRHSPM